MFSSDTPTVVHTEHFDVCKEIMTRKEEYDAKHLPQEVSIIGHLSKYIGDNSVIIDAGGGNGELSYKISKIFPKNLVIMVDKYMPWHVIKSDTFVRIECDFADKERLDTELSKYITADKEVIVICKHLCGSGLDFAMNYFCNSHIKMTHFVLAMCCCAKIDLSFGHFDPDSEITTEMIKKSSWITLKTCPNYFKGKEYVEKIFNYRIKKYQKLGYDVEACHYVDKEITPFNYLVVGHDVSLYSKI
jgi:hypothetical protein